MSDQNILQLSIFFLLTGDQIHQEETEQPLHRLQQEPEWGHHRFVLHQRRDGWVLCSSVELSDSHTWSSPLCIKWCKRFGYRWPPWGLPELSGERRREAEGHSEISSLLPHHEEMPRPRNPQEARGGLQLPLQRGEIGNYEDVLSVSTFSISNKNIVLTKLISPIWEQTIPKFNHFVLCVRVFQENSGILKELIELRAQKSSLLGFSTHADFILEMNMAKSGKKVATFLGELCRAIICWYILVFLLGLCEFLWWWLLNQWWSDKSQL